MKLGFYFGNTTVSFAERAVCNSAAINSVLFKRYASQESTHTFADCPRSLHSIPPKIKGFDNSSRSSEYVSKLFRVALEEKNFDKISADMKKLQQFFQHVDNPETYTKIKWQIPQNEVPKEFLAITPGVKYFGPCRSLSDSYFKNPTQLIPEVEKILKKIMDKFKVDKQVRNLFEIVAHHKQSHKIQDILNSWCQLAAAYAQEVEVTIITARPLSSDAELERAVTQIVDSQHETGQKFIIKQYVKPEILDGYQIVVGETILSETQVDLESKIASEFDRLMHAKLSKGGTVF